MAVVEAGRQLRAPRAAAVAGLLFAGLFAAAMALLRSSALLGASDEQIRAAFAAGEELTLVVGALYLAPFAGVMFLWFIAVVRDRIGEREDRFFATVFFGSGLLFVSLLFAGCAVIGSLVVGVYYLGHEPPTAHEVRSAQALAYALLFAFATRAGAVFLISMATIALRSRTFPRWVSWTGYVLGLGLLVVVSFWDWIILVLPAWVAVVSVFILARGGDRAADAGGA